MNAAQVLRKISELVEQLAADDYEHTEREKSAIMMDSFAALGAVAVMTHSDIVGMRPKAAYQKLCDHIEENVAEMILEEADEQASREH